MAKEEEQTEAADGQALPEFNQANIAGRLKDAPRFSNSGTDKYRAQFGLRVSRASRNEGNGGKMLYDDITIVGWRAIAKQCEGLAKGDAVQIQGCIRTWKDQKGGFRWNVEADTIQVIERQKASSAARQAEPVGA